MTPYANKGGDSNVVAYEVSGEGILVQFGDNSVYTYTNSSAGGDNVARMEELAEAGQGLNSFINKEVAKRYASKS